MTINMFNEVRRMNRTISLKTVIEYKEKKKQNRVVYYHK